MFNGKASIQDVTNPDLPVTIDGNSSLQVSMADAGDTSKLDRIAITVYNKNNALWYSSNWSGIKTAEQLLNVGNLKVSSSASTSTGNMLTTTMVSSSANPSTLGQGVTFTASILDQHTSVPTGSITFFNGTTLLGTVRNLEEVNGRPTAKLFINNLSIGSHSITAYYGGDSKFASSSAVLTQQVNAATITIASTETPMEITKQSDEKLTVSAYPNPSVSHFTLKLASSNTSDPISVRVMNQMGQILEIKSNLTAGQTIQLGSNYRPGTYIVQMVQGQTSKQMKLVKAAF
jgi:hypothetical protein